jgi:hypothetical protein
MRAAQRAGPWEAEGSVAMNFIPALRFFAAVATTGSPLPGSLSERPGEGLGVRSPSRNLVTVR